eukprot:13947054-Ditylum_brightwellii.AAC.1
MALDTLNGESVLRGFQQWLDRRLIPAGCQDTASFPIMEAAIKMDELLVSWLDSTNVNKIVLCIIKQQRTTHTTTQSHHLLKLQQPHKEKEDASTALPHCVILPFCCPHSLEYSDDKASVRVPPLLPPPPPMQYDAREKDKDTPKLCIQDQVKASRISIMHSMHFILCRSYI